MGDDCLGSGSKCVYTRDGAASFRSPLSLPVAYSSLLEYKPVSFACLNFVFFLPQGIPDKQDKIWDGLESVNMPLAGFMLALTLI